MGGGGAERQLAMLVAELPRHGWTVDVGYLDGGANLARLERSGATLHHLKVRSPYDPMLFGRLTRLMRDVRPAVLQTWLPAMDIAGGLVATMRGVPWIVSERATCPLPPSLKQRLRDSVIHRATAVVSNSRAALETWQRAHPRVARHYVPNAVLLDEIDAVPAASRIASKVVLAAGRLADQKNFAVFLEAMSRVRREIDAVAVICGTGPRESALRAAAGEGIVFAGFVDDLWSRMKAADLFVSLSHFEGRPNTVMEAFGCRTPVLLSDIAEHRELGGSDVARFVDQRDVEAVASAILDELRDPEQGRERAAAARRLVETFTISSVAKEYASVYRSVSKGTR